MKRTFRRKLFAGLGGLALALSISALWSGHAESQDGQRGPQDPAAAALQAARVGHSVNMEIGTVVTGVRKFTAGNRTYWHSHAGGFIFFVQGGRGRVQRRGEAMKELGPGEIDYTPPGVEHWHGAAPNSELIQLGVVPGGGAIQFKEEVTDAQYNGTAR